MPTFASLTVNDGQGTPVAHTFAPLQKEGGVATFVDRSPLIAPGWKSIKHEVVSAQQAGASNRVKVAFSDPVVGTVDGQLTVVRKSTANVNLNFAQDATDQERKDMIAYVINYLSNVTVKNGAIALEPWY